jgi:uncharacterized protein YndB with AHSA1/START domain
MTDPDLDLVLERHVDLPPEPLWRGWTEPTLLMQWFTPAPWRTVDAELDLRPGGIFRTTMRSPEGESFDNAGCFLEVAPNRKLVWTNALEPGYRPARPSPDATAHDFVFTAIVTLEPEGQGTRYTATALHRDRAGRDTHAQMGFHEGWGAALDQLVALARTL